VLSSRRFLAALSSLLVAACALVPAVAAADTVPVGEAPTLPEGATPLGAVAPAQELSLYVALEPRDPAALEAFATEVSTPGSPVYGQYLSVAGFGDRFGATPSQVAAVRGALESRGLAVGPTSPNNLSLPVEATAAEAEAAFDTDLVRVRTTDGRVAYANADAPRLPAAAAPYVGTVVGLNDLNAATGTAAKPAAAPLDPAPLGPETPRTTGLTSFAGGPQPCAEAYETSDKEGGYTANQIASAYGLTSFYEEGNFGAGQTVALLEMEPFYPADIAHYQDCYGTRATVETVNVEGGPAPYKAKDGGESELDIEQIIGLAPEAKILVYQGPNPSTPQLIHTWVTENRAKVMSSSWGSCEDETAAEEYVAVSPLLQEAAAQGQSFFNASGDNGATSCFSTEPKDENKTVSVLYPASDPFATGVGGTRLEQPTTPPVQYIWSDGVENGAGGGGVSAHFAMPSYQAGADASLMTINPESSGAPCAATAGYCRQVPDVSADADPETSYVVNAEKKWQIIGGTSAATPLWAAFTTLANGSEACGGKSIGFANPALYAIGGSAYVGNFDDITSAREGGPKSNEMFNEALPFFPRDRYDMTTGIGSPVGATLGATLCALANPAVPPTPPAPPAPPAPDPAKRDDDKAKATPAPAPAPAPVPAKLLNSRLAGVANGAPRLSFGLEARTGGRLEVIKIALPAGLTPGAKKALTAGVVATAGGKTLKVAVRRAGNAIQVRLLAPAPAVSLRIGGAALTVSSKLRDRVRSHHAKSLHLVVTSTEAGGASSSFPLQLKL
jgi:hypothetical protein